MADPAIIIGSFAEMFDNFAKQQAQFQSSLESLLKKNNAILEKNNQTFEYMNEAQERYLSGRPTDVQAPREVKEKENKVLIDGYTTQGKKEYKKLNVEPEPEATKPEEQKEGGILSTIFKFIGAGALGIAGVMGLKKLLSEDTIDKLKSFSQEITDKTNIRFLTSRLKKGFTEFLDKTISSLFTGMKIALSALVANFHEYLPENMKTLAFQILGEADNFTDAGGMIGDYIKNLPIVKYFTNIFKAGANLFGSDVYKKEALFQFFEALGFSRKFGENFDGLFNFALDSLEFAGVDRAGELEGFAGFKTLVGESIKKGLKNLGNYLSTFLTNIFEDIRTYFGEVSEFYRIKYLPLTELDVEGSSSRLLKMFKDDKDTDLELKRKIDTELINRDDETAQKIKDEISKTLGYDLDVLSKTEGITPEEMEMLRETISTLDPISAQTELEEKMKSGDLSGLLPFQRENFKALQKETQIENLPGSNANDSLMMQRAIEGLKDAADKLQKSQKSERPELLTKPEDLKQNQSFNNINQTLNNTFDLSGESAATFFRQTALA